MSLRVQKNRFSKFLAQKKTAPKGCHLSIYMCV